MDQAVEYASLAERRVLYYAMAPWLLTKGVYRERSDDDFLGLYDGVPVRLSPVVYSAKILGGVVRQLLPQAASKLAVGPALQIELQPAYYEDFAEREAFIGSYLRLYVERDTEVGGVNECILLDGPDSEQAFTTVRMYSSNSGMPIGLDVDAVGGGWQLNRETGLDNLSVTESVAWLDIVDRLDDLRAAS